MCYLFIHRPTVFWVSFYLELTRKVCPVHKSSLLVPRNWHKLTLCIFKKVQISKISCLILKLLEIFFTLFFLEMKFIVTIYNDYIAILCLLGHSHNVLWVIVIVPNPGVSTLRKNSCLMHDYSIPCAHFKILQWKKICKITITV